MGSGRQIAVWIVSGLIIVVLGARTWPAGPLWSVSGTLVAGAAWTLAIQGKDFARIARLGQLTVGSVLSSWMTALVSGGLMFILPAFLACFAVYRQLREVPYLHSLPGAAFYGSAWHLVAHLLVVTLWVREIHGQSVTGAIYLLLPLLIGLLWGLWLPSIA